MYNVSRGTLLFIITYFYNNITIIYKKEVYKITIKIAQYVPRETSKNALSTGKKKNTVFTRKNI